MDEKNNKNSLLAEFYIEFLGSLVPGLFALIITVLSLAPALIVFCTTPEEEQLLSIPSNFNFGLGAYGLTGFLLIVAYVLGSIFYRQDPKKPDWKSAIRVYKKENDDEKNRLAVQPRNKLENEKFLFFFKRTNIKQSDAQFPYYFLHEYLVGRGLGHLAYLVPWQGREKDTWNYRTKMYINQMKIRLQFLVPEKCKEIVRNEAHVRLATSVWYASQWIIWVCCVGFALVVAAYFKKKHPEITFIYASAACSNIFFALLAFYIRNHIVKFIHYLRVREVVYVLETAYFAELNKINLHREDFDPKQKEEHANKAIGAISSGSAPNIPHVDVRKKK